MPSGKTRDLELARIDRQAKARATVFAVAESVGRSDTFGAKKTTAPIVSFIARSPDHAAWRRRLLVSRA